jgi:hypothetical protein
MHAADIMGLVNDVLLLNEPVPLMNLNQHQLNWLRSGIYGVDGGLLCVGDNVGI